MKKLILLLFICSVITAQDFSDIQPKGLDKGKRSLNSFRGIPFGSTKQYVIENERVSLEKQVVQGSVEMYFGTAYLTGKETLVTYNFIDNIFLQAMYILQAEHSNRNFYIDDYNQFKDLLIDKYGSPSAQDIVWNNRLYQDNIEDYGLAISIGHLKYYSQWKFDNGDVRITLDGDNYDTKLVLLYTTSEYFDKRDKASNVLDDF